MKDKKPMFCTVVDPSEYDIARDVKRLITIANKNKEMYAPVDVGKFVGLYEAWEEQAKEIEFQKTEAIKINVDWGKAEATIAEQARDIERLRGIIKNEKQKVKRWRKVPPGHEVERLRESIERHRQDVWGDGVVQHDSDITLYEVLK